MRWKAVGISDSATGYFDSPLSVISTGSPVGISDSPVGNTDSLTEQILALWSHLSIAHFAGHRLASLRCLKDSLTARAALNAGEPSVIQAFAYPFDDRL